MTDDIARLADELKLAASSPDGPRRIEAIAAKLRTLAQGAKTGGVAWECTGGGLKRYVTDKQYLAFTPAVQRWYKPYHCTNCTLAHSPEAWVTDEMVDRLAKHLCREEWKNRCPTMEQMAAQLIHARRYHDEARAMLTAALTPQPKDAT